MIVQEKPKPVYQCLKCEYKFRVERPGPTDCLKCKHVYVKWLNYEFFQETKPKPKAETEHKSDG